jgi:pimeloyl-ACP methyl ester carboxylesterase
MTDYVLIHGAWHGSWCWARVRRLLAAGAHGVFTPTLTGVGERSHLLSRDVGLDTHIADVANLMIWENLRDVVLVGHSYSGFVARHVADRMPDRIRSLIYLDAFVPENGKTLFDYLPDNGEGDRSFRSPTTVLAPPPHCFASVSSSGLRRPVAMILAPACASAIAVALPMPALAPVTSTALPDNGMLIRPPL